MSAQVHVAPSAQILRHPDLESHALCLGNSSSLGDSNNRIFNRLIIRASRYQEPPMSHGHTSRHVSFPFPHTRDTRDPPEGTEFSNLNLLYGYRINCPWPYLNFKAMMLRPFFHCLSLPSPDGGAMWPCPAPGGSWWPRLVTIVHCSLLVTSPQLRHNNVHNTAESQGTYFNFKCVHFQWFVTK